MQRDGQLAYDPEGLQRNLLDETEKIAYAFLGLILPMKTMGFSLARSDAAAFWLFSRKLLAG